MQEKNIKNYQTKLVKALTSFEWSPVVKLAKDIKAAWKDGRHVFLCGNGGSAANAAHIANDFLYPTSRLKGKGIKTTALSVNQAILTCLGNDVGYENIFSFQLKTLGAKRDILIVLSGSGNSPNILEAVNIAKKIGMNTYAILGFDGGKCLKLVDTPIHFAVNDMQISEDLQLIVGHMLMQWLCQE